MKSKKSLHHTWRILRPINSWIFLGLAIVFGLIGVFALRQNNLRAIELRDKVLAADKAGEDVEGPLRELREFTYSHMNANLASDTSVQHPVQLKYRYERLLAKEKDRVASANDNVYTDAQRHCEARFGGGGLRNGRVQCVQEYISEHSESEQSIPDALYKFNFVSPVWSADLAGVSLLLSTVFFALFVLRYLLERWFKSQLDQHM